MFFERNSVKLTIAVYFAEFLLYFVFRMLYFIVIVFLKAKVLYFIVSVFYKAKVFINSLVLWGVREGIFVTIFFFFLIHTLLFLSLR